MYNTPKLITRPRAGRCASGHRAIRRPGLEALSGVLSRDYNGEGVQEDDARAASLYEQACNGGHAPGRNNPGVMYEKGGGFPHRMWRCTISPILGRSTAAVLTTTVVLCVIAACGGEESTGPGSTNPPPSSAVASVVVSPSADTLAFVGETTTLSASARDASGNTIQGKTFTWSSDDESTATVNTSGQATATGSGDATITATTDGVSGNATIYVIQVPTALSFLQQPSDAGVGGIIIPEIQVTLLDAGGAIATNATDLVTVSLGVNPSGATLNGTTTDEADGGVASFYDLSIDQVGAAFQLVATSGNLTSGPSDPFDVLYMPVFTALPSVVEVNTPITPPIQVALQDGAGNTITSASASITLRIHDDPTGDAELSGTTTVITVNGVATFDDITLNRGGQGFTLAASGTEIGDRHSASFDALLSLSVIGAGGSHTCGIQVTGKLYCWGDDNDGQLGDGSSRGSGERPISVDSDLSFIAVSAGDKHTCAVASGGSAYCWGPNELGQLGDGNEGVDSDSPVQVSGNLTFVSISAGRDHTCGVANTGAAYCWGSNLNAQIGASTSVNCPGSYTGNFPCSPVPIEVDGGLTFETVAAGGAHTCGVASGGVAYCWGHNGDEQLGTTTIEMCPISGLPCSTTPVAVDGMLTFSKITAGREHTCGTTAPDGVTYCWGADRFGERGDGDQGYAGLAPSAVQGPLALVGISSGPYHVCGTTAAGDAYCWGHNFDGQLGDGNAPNHRDTPAIVLGGLEFSSIGAGGDNGYHTCGVTPSGEGYCWGYDFFGQLGNGYSLSDSDTPTRVSPP